MTAHGTARSFASASPTRHPAGTWRPHRAAIKVIMRTVRRFLRFCFQAIVAAFAERLAVIAVSALL